MNQLLKVGDIARYLQVRRPTVYQWIRDGRIPALRVGTRWRFRKEDIDKWMEMETAFDVDAVGRFSEIISGESKNKSRRRRVHRDRAGIAA